MDFLVRHKAIIAFISFTLFCLIALTLQSTTVVITAEGIGSAIMSPFQKGYNVLQEGVSTFWAGFTDLRETRQELQKTREQLQRYESISDEFTEIRRENVRLRSLLEMKERIEHRSVPASVISKDPDNWFRTIVVDRGSRDGIEINMPVVAYYQGLKAVVGKVVEVRSSISRIAPIISPAVRVGVKLQESRFPGLLSGYSSNAGICVMDYISRVATVKPGDMVITSGQAGVFPQGLVVGRVIRVDEVEASAYRRAVVQPAVNYNLLEEVFIIMKKPDLELLKVFGEKE